MQHEAGQLEGKPNTNNKILGTIILCSVFTIYGLGMLSLACLELYQLQKENHRLWSDLNLMNEKNTLDRKQIEAEKGRLQLENQQLKSMATGLGLEMNQMKNRITHLQSELSQVQNKSTKLAEDYQQVSAENKLLQSNLTYCQSERQQMEDENKKLQSRLDEHCSNNTLLLTELEKERSMAKTLSGIKQMLEDQNRLLVENLTRIPYRIGILFAENALLYSNLTSCQSKAQHWEKENRDVWSQLYETSMNNTLLNEKLTDARITRKKLSGEKQHLKANLSLVQESSPKVARENSFLQSNLTLCRSEKEKYQVENDDLLFELNKICANNTLLGKEVVHEKLMVERLAGKNQLLVNTNQLLQLNLSFVHNTSETLSVETSFLITNLTSCLLNKQHTAEENKQLQLKLNETCVNATLLRGELANASSRRETLFEEILLLRANLTLAQNKRFHLSSENISLRSILTSCHSEQQVKEVENRNLHLKLKETHANNTLLKKEFDKEKLKTQTLSAEKPLLENTNKLLEFNLTRVQNTRENVSAENQLLNSNLQHCRSENQLKEHQRGNMQLELDETLTNKTFLRRALNSQMSRRKTLSEENQLLQTNLTIVQHLQANLSAENNFLRLNLTFCLAEIPQEKERNDKLKSNLNETRVNNTLLHKELARERLTTETLSTEKQLLEHTNKILQLNLTVTQNTSENLNAERYILRSNLTSCQTKKEHRQKENRNLRQKLNETWANNTVLKEELSMQRSKVETALARNQLLKSNLTLVQVTWANISAENRLLQSSLTSCQSERRALEDERIRLLLKRAKKLLQEIKRVLLLNISVSQNRCANLSAENSFLLTNLNVCQSEKQHLEDQNRILQLRLNQTKTSVTLVIEEWTNVMLKKEMLLTDIPLLRNDVLLGQNSSTYLLAAIALLKSNLSSCEANRTMLVERNQLAIIEKTLLLTNITDCLSEKHQEKNKIRNLWLELNETHVNMTLLEGELTKEASVKDRLAAEISALQDNITQAENMTHELSLKELLFQSTLRDCEENNLKLDQAYLQAQHNIEYLQVHMNYVLNLTAPLKKTIGIHKAKISAIQANLSLVLLEKRKLLTILHSPRLRIDRFCNLDTLQCLSCPVGWKQFNSRCYNITEHVTRWKKARSICLGKGSDLAVVRNLPEQIFLVSFVNNYNIQYLFSDQIYEGSWVGLIDSVREGKFIWIDNRDTAFSYWTEGNPNNMITSWDVGNDGQDCAVFVPTKNMSLYNWDDSQCRNHRSYICEAKAFIINPFDPKDS